jgi:hypothetical protein
MSLKVNFLDFRHGKAVAYQGKWSLSMLVDYCWTLERCSTGDIQQKINHRNLLGNVKTH